MTRKSDAETLRDLADRQAITDLIYRYCRAVDRLDQELGASIWHEDGEADFGELYRGSGHDWMTFTCEAHRQKVLTHSHQITNIIMQVDGDSAVSEAYVTAAARITDDGKMKHWMLWGRYLDRWSYRGGRWGIDKRIYVEDFSEVREVVPIGVEQGKRDRTDPSYAIFA